MSTNEIMVFFYGLFMDQSLLASKGVHPTELAIGYLDGYGLCIGDRATLLPEAHSRAYGVLMKIAAEDAAALYSERSVADYVAEPVVVTSRYRLFATTCRPQSWLERTRSTRHPSWRWRQSWDCLTPISGKSGIPPEFLDYSTN